MRSKLLPILIGLVIGLTAAVALYFIQMIIPPGTPAHHLILIVFFPAELLVRGLIYWFSPENIEVGGFYFSAFVHPSYCLFLGGMIGFGVTRLSRRFLDPPEGGRRGTT